MYQKVIKSESRIQSLEADDLLNSGIVMDRVAKDLTQQYCNIVAESKGDILDVGFGLGFSANFFYELGVESYTCIEIDEQIYQLALAWAKNKQNVTIIKGDWIDVIPTLTKKFDGIFMDTYGDRLSKYRKFERYAATVAKENCCLAMWEYAQVRKPTSLNSKVVEVDQSDYELLLRPYHVVCWSYFVANEFRKQKYYRQHKNVIPLKLCQEIIQQNKKYLVEEHTKALVQSIIHERKLKLCRPRPNKKLEKILNEQLLPRFEFLNLKDMDIFFFCYDEGDRYDRHVETIKHIALAEPEQRVETFEIPLNSDYRGGELKVFDIWLTSDRINYSVVEQNPGDVIEYKPYQHVENTEVVEGTRYSLLFHIRNKNKKIKKTLL